MLFISDIEAVSSVAEIVRINAAAENTIHPSTNITAGPTGPIPVSTASFTWSGNDDITGTGDLVYATRLEPLETAFSTFGSATTKSYSNLANGNYTFHVKARDQAGNEDTTPETQAFTVNVTGGVCPAEITLDNLGVGQSDSQRSFTGVWTGSTSAGQFGRTRCTVTGADRTPTHGGAECSMRAGMHVSGGCVVDTARESVNERADYREWADRGADDEEL